MKKTLCIYHDYIPYIGGIETAIYNLAKRLKEHYEITIVFRNAQSPLSVIKYSQNANVIKLSSIEKTLHFDFLLIGSNHLKPKELEGSKVLQWVHSDYSKYNIDLVQNKIDEYISVSKSAGEVFTKLFNKNTTTIPNIADIDFKDYKKPLTLITNSRVSIEKGFGRMYEFAKGLKDNNIDFKWLILGSNSASIHEQNKLLAPLLQFKEVHFLGYQEDVRFFLSMSDYLVQLSDFEGCPLSVVEALTMGKPCILTNFPSAKELINVGENGYIVDLDMKNIDYKTIAEKIPNKFIYKDNIDKWLKILQ